MTANKYFNRPKFPFHNGKFVAVFLILISSVLLAIWATRGTIGLRNILLVIGAILSLIYCRIYFRVNPYVGSLRGLIPLMCLCLVFFWVIVHYLFFSRFPDIQTHELMSTWFRSGLASILALGLGLALLSRPAAINFLWAGILLSFGYLFYQYIPRAIAGHTPFIILDPDYIYSGKINGVLAGTIFIAGSLGSVLDCLGRGKRLEIICTVLLWIVGTTSILYSYVFMFISMGGIGLAVLIYCVAFFLIIPRALFFILKGRRAKEAFATIILIILGLSVALWFGVRQAQYNSGWTSLWEDVKISYQVDRYPNWQNYEQMGVPARMDGISVKPSTYVRVAWAVAGMRILLPDNLLGAGILSQPFYSLLKEKNPESNVASSHSGWVDILLAFGIFGAPLLIMALLSAAYLSIFFGGCFGYSVPILSISIIFLYSVGELSSQHAIEILFFMIALFSSLTLSGRPEEPDYNV